MYKDILFALCLIQCVPSPNENLGAPQHSNAHAIKNKLNIKKTPPPGATASNYLLKKKTKRNKKRKIGPPRVTLLDGLGLKIARLSEQVKSSISSSPALSTSLGV